MRLMVEVVIDHRSSRKLKKFIHSRDLYDFIGDNLDGIHTIGSLKNVKIHARSFDPTNQEKEI